MLLQNVWTADKKIRVKGVGSIQMIVDEVGLLEKHLLYMRQAGI
jgi:hypothetical protein